MWLKQIHSGNTKRRRYIENSFVCTRAIYIYIYIHLRTTRTNDEQTHCGEDQRRRCRRSRGRCERNHRAPKNVRRVRASVWQKAGAQTERPRVGFLGWRVMRVVQMLFVQINAHGRAVNETPPLMMHFSRSFYYFFFQSYLFIFSALPSANREEIRTNRPLCRIVQRLEVAFFFMCRATQ